MTAPAVTGLLRRAGEWLVEPAAQPRRRHDAALAPVPSRSHALVAVVGLARRCGCTTLARALAAELAAREDGAAVVASPTRPEVVALGSSAAAVRLAEALVELDARRAAGRLCLAACEDAARLADVTRELAPAVIEAEPGCATLEAARVVDRVVLVAPPSLEPALAAAVGETIAAVGAPPVVAVNRAPHQGPWLVRADVLVPESRMAARMALAGREPRGGLGRAVQHVADLCAGA